MRQLKLLLACVAMFMLVMGVSSTTLASSSSKAKDVSKSVANEVMEKVKPININTADLESFMSLPGIGEKRAKDILDYRKKIGAFKKVEELMDVPGIGEGVFNGIKDFIKLK